MKVLYLGDTKVTTGSAQRARALERMGHTIECLDPERAIVRSRVADIFHYRTGYRFLQRRVKDWLEHHLQLRRYNLVWVDSGATLGADAVKLLRKYATRTVNYNCDDPTGRRDWARWHSFRKAIPVYDALTVVRDESAREYCSLGARQIIQVLRSYDEIDLAPRILTSTERQRWSSEVIFVGTWMPERGPFLADLVKRNIPLAVYGDHWPKAKEWETLKVAYRGAAIEGRDYVAAIQCAKIAIGLLSKGNRDLHTIRSSEVPYIGTMFCAQRTSEHLAMYKDKNEAVFWSTSAECASLCREYLGDDSQRRQIADAGRRKVLKLNLSHGAVMNTILERIWEGHSESAI